MHYPFPTIMNINDVLPAIEGRSEFIVAEREHFDVINYVVVTPESFEMTGPDDRLGAIRRECRGLIFDKSGAIISRPFHKFFNLGERDETMPNNLNMMKVEAVYEKMDGSMVRPLMIDGEIRLATKMGLTDIGSDAEKLLTARQKLVLASLMKNRITPIFEYVAPTNKIVVHYSEARLVLLAARHIQDGTYFQLEDVDKYGVFEHVKRWNWDAADVDSYVTKVRQETDREGDVVRFLNGHCFKSKNDWYVRIHKVKDRISQDRNILDIIVNEEIDDVYPLLDKVDHDRVMFYEIGFWNSFNNALDRIEGLYKLAVVIYDGNKKRVALEMVPNLIKKEDAKFLFKMLDGDRDLRGMMIEYVKKNVSTGANYDKLMDWLK